MVHGKSSEYLRSYFEMIPAVQKVDHDELDFSDEISCQIHRGWGEFQAKFGRGVSFSQCRFR